MIIRSGSPEFTRFDMNYPAQEHELYVPLSGFESFSKFSILEGEANGTILVDKDKQLRWFNIIMGSQITNTSLQEILALGFLTNHDKVTQILATLNLFPHVEINPLGVNFVLPPLDSKGSSTLLMGVDAEEKVFIPPHVINGIPLDNQWRRNRSMSRKANFTPDSVGLDFVLAKSYRSNSFGQAPAQVNFIGSISSSRDATARFRDLLNSSVNSSGFTQPKIEDLRSIVNSTAIIETAQPS